MALSSGAVLHRSAALTVYALAVWAGFHAWIVLYEEPRLRRQFGGEYESYCARARRWVPRLGRGKPGQVRVRLRDA